MPHQFENLDIDERVKRVLRQTPLFDGHNDLPQQPRGIFHGKIHSNPEFDFGNGFQRGMTDIPRLRQGAVGAQFWSILVPCLRSAEDFSAPDYSDMARDAIEQIDLTTRLMQSYPEHFEFAYEPEDVERIYAQGKIACSIGIEGLHMAGNSIGIIRAFYSLGVRYCTLAHVCNNAFADSSTSKVGTVHGGLSKLGQAAIKEMNRIGMIIDLSHVSPETATQSLNLSRAPVMFSHSNANSVYSHPRNVPDEVLDLIHKNGGIIMVTFVPKFLARTTAESSINHVVDHIFYIANRIGWDHVGIGSDFDGIPSVVPGLEDVSKYPKLLEAVLERGATEEQLGKLCGKNMIRVWKGVAATRKTMAEEGVEPVEDTWEGRTWWRWGGHYQIPDPDPEDKMGWDWYVPDEPVA